MDTLFRLVSFQQPHPQQHHQHQQQQSDHSFNNSTSATNSSSDSIRSSNKQNPNFNNNNNNNNYYYQNYYNSTTQDQEECFNFFMDEEDFSSSSSHNKPYNSHNNTTTDNSNYFYYQHQHQHQHQQQYQSASQSVLLDPSSTTTSTPTDTPPPSHHQGAGGGCQFDFSSPSAYIGKWASNALLEAGRAVSAGDTARLHQLIWVLNEVSSPYGDVEQKLASYFTQALFTRLTESGDTCHRNMRLAVDKTFSFESTRKMLLKFQEVSPWSTFGHVACNGALIDALEGEPKLHIIDISNTFCTQWPTLLEALATRMDDTPHLKITTVLVDKYGGGGGGVVTADGGVHRVMREIGNRLEKFARLMGVPFKFNVVHHNGDLSCLDFATLDLSDDEALAINCVNTLHGVSVHRRDAVLAAFRQLNPRVVAMVEEEADIGDVSPNDGGFEFMRGFSECLRWFRVYFESLDETFPRTSNEKLMLERAAGRAMVDLLAGPEGVSAERRETAGRWSGRMGRAGMGHVGFSEEVCDDVRALLRRYKEGWSMTPCSGGDSGGSGGGGGGAGIFLCWKDQPVVWASAWKP